MGLSAKTETPTNDEIHLEIVKIWEVIISIYENQKEIFDMVKK